MIVDDNAHNPYALLSGNPEDLADVTKKVTAILKQAVSQIEKVNKKYNKKYPLGFGDTATDEAIADEFYTILHSPQRFLN
jgi:hypothetical protein